MALKDFKIAKRSRHTSAREQRKENKIREKILTARRKSRQMLQKLVDCAREMKVSSDLGLPPGRVKELWALFAKDKPIGNELAQHSDKQLRLQGLKDLGTAKKFIEQYGIKQKHKEDLTYGPLEEADNYGDTSEQSEVDNEKDGAEDDATNEVEDDSMDIDAEEARAGIEGLQINDMSNAEAELDAILARPSKPIKLKLICRKRD